MKHIVIITGASRGIGFAIAQHFCHHQFTVINLSRHPCSLQDVINIQVDFSDLKLEENLRPILLPLLRDAGQIILVHNAANLEKDTVETLETQAFRRSLEIGVVAPAILNRLVIPNMPNGSAILYIGSTLSEKAVNGKFSYVTIKHAVVGMMRATCQDLFGRGIHTVCICPGFTDTAMVRTHLKNDADALEHVKAMSSAGRLIEPAEIAEIIYFAATHPVLNGAVIHANLGQKEQ